MPIKTNIKDLTPAKDKYSKSFKLISGGLINGSYFPDGSITVKPWDYQIDEWISNRASKGQLKGRNFLLQIFSKICDLNGCPVDKFIASEVMMVLMLSRSILRNDEIDYFHSCPHCGHEAKDRVKIPDQLEKIGEKKLGWHGYDEFTLPISNDVVRVRPVTVGEEAAIMDRSDKDRQIVGDDVARVMSGILSVGGGSPDNPAELLKWIQALHPSDTESLIKKFNEFQPQLSQILHILCDSCGKKYDYSLSLNEDFFRSSSEARDGKSV